MDFKTANDDRFTTLKIMALGLIAAILLNIPMFATIYDRDWQWAYGFPLGWLEASLSYMTVFFHELGHAVAYWFYGYVTVPAFDFKYGGGVTVPLTDQLFLLNAALYAFSAYIFWHARGHVFWQIMCVALVLFHLATAYFPIHHVVCIYAGPLAQPIVASYLLTRAWLDLPGRGAGERFFSAAYGFGMIGQVFLNGWALVHNDVWRLVFFEQKGGHGLGDFDKIAEGTNMNFSTAVWVWMGVAVIALIVPVILYIRDETDYPS